jgi:bacteriocin-like protein
MSDDVVKNNRTDEMSDEELKQVSGGGLAVLSPALVPAPLNPALVPGLPLYA